MSLTFLLRDVEKCHITVKQIVEDRSEQSCLGNLTTRMWVRKIMNVTLGYIMSHSVLLPIRVGGHGRVVGANTYAPSSSWECWEIGASLAAARRSRRIQVRSSLRSIWFCKVTLHRVIKSV